MGVNVAAVEVETHDDGLRVSWSLVADHGEGPADGPGAHPSPATGPDAAVDIAVGPTPDHIDHTHVLRAEPDVRRVVLRDLGPGRHYVSVSPSAGGSAVVAAERRVAFEGVRNFRDLGGYPTAAGGRTRWGRVFRADALGQLTVTDLAAYEQLGLRAVFDLRGDRERLDDPNPVESRHLAFSQPHDERPDLSLLQTHEHGERRLAGQYVDILETVAPSIGELLANLVDPGGLPAVFHCAGGKDRTGLAAALLLSTLGVDRGTVLDDYELTGRFRTIEHEPQLVATLVGIGFGRPAIGGMMGTPRWAMAGALDHLDQHHGGVEPYLIGPAGLDPEVIDELRHTLVV